MSLCLLLELVSHGKDFSNTRPRTYVPRVLGGVIERRGCSAGDPDARSWRITRARWVFLARVLSQTAG